MQQLDTKHADVDRIFGGYRVLGLLGRGGMGLVYLCEHVKLGHRMALKRLRRPAAHNPESLSRFFDEARAVNAINHPNIVEITNFFQDGSEVFFVMEVLEGQPLSAIIKHNGFVPLPQALDITHQVACALAAAQATGVVHLDIKPSNIFMAITPGRPDYVKLLDFGLARLPEVQQELALEAPASRPVGTPQFMSPEQTQSAELDHRSDLYSLGAVLYTMLSGRPPFEAQQAVEYYYKHLQEPPTPLRRLAELPQPVPPAVDRLVLRCLAKQPEDRYESFDLFRRELERLAPAAVGLRLEEGHCPVPEQVSPWRSRRRLAAVLATTLASVVLLGSFGIWALRGRQSVQPPSLSRPVAIPSAQRAAPRATQVSLRVNTLPPGAEVRRILPQGGDVLLGITPLTVTVPLADRTWRLVLRLVGHREVRRDVRLSARSPELTVTLDPLARPRPVPSPRKRPQARPRQGPRQGPRQRPPLAGSAKRPRPRARRRPMDLSWTVDPFRPRPANKPTRQRPKGQSH